MVELQFGKERWLQATAVDLSETGIRCVLDEDIADNTPSVYFQLKLGETEGEANIIEMEAVLIHTQLRDDGKVDAGFQFTLMPAASRRALQAFLETAQPAED